VLQYSDLVSHSTGVDGTECSLPKKSSADNAVLTDNSLITKVMKHLQQQHHYQQHQLQQQQLQPPQPQTGVRQSQLMDNAVLTENSLITKVMKHLQQQHQFSTASAVVDYVYLLTTYFQFQKSAETSMHP